MENYLENRNIISNEMLEAIDIIIKLHPDIVFGGSIGLNAIGVIKRPVHDIDLMLPINANLSQYTNLIFFMPPNKTNKERNDLLQEADDTFLSDTTTDVNGVEIQRVSAKVNGIKICIFKLPTLTYSKFTFSGRTINIQNINEAILAKRAYAKIDSKSKAKHMADIIDIENFFP